MKIIVFLLLFHSALYAGTLCAETNLAARSIGYGIELAYKTDDLAQKENIIQSLVRLSFLFWIQNKNDLHREEKYKIVKMIKCLYFESKNSKDLILKNTLVDALSDPVYNHKNVMYIDCFYQKTGLEYNKDVEEFLIWIKCL